MGLSRSVSPLIRALSDADEEVRGEAVERLGDLGPEGGRAIPALIARLADEEAHVRWQAVRALGAIGETTGDVLAALEEALDDQDDEVRVAAVEALADARDGGGRREAIRALREVAAGDRKELVDEFLRGPRGREIFLGSMTACLRAIPAAVARVLAPGSWEVDDAVRSRVAIEAGVVGGLLESYDPYERIAVAVLLAASGRRVDEALTALITALLEEGDDESPDLARQALVRLGPAFETYAPGLRTALASGPRATRRAAIAALARIGSPTGLVVDCLKGLLWDCDVAEDESGQLAAARCLARVEPGFEEVIYSLKTIGLFPGDGEFEQEAIRVLGELLPTSGRAAAALVEILLKDDYRDWDSFQTACHLVATAAEGTFDGVRLSSEDMGRVLRFQFRALDQVAADTILRCASAASRVPLEPACRAFRTLGSGACDLSAFEGLGPEAAELAVPVLLELLDIPCEEIIRDAALALGRLRPVEAIEALLDRRFEYDSLDDPGAVVVRILDAADPAEVLSAYRSSEDVPRLLELAELGGPEFRRATDHALETILGGDAVPVLSQILADGYSPGGRRLPIDHRVRSLAARAVGALGPSGRAAFPALNRVLDEEPADCLRRAALEALLRIGPLEDVALALLTSPGKGGDIPALAAALRADDEQARHAAITVCGLLGPAATDAIPALVTIATDSCERSAIRCAALGALTRIAQTDEVLLALWPGLEDRDAGVRSAAVAALGALGPGMGDAAYGLVAVASDPREEPAVRAAAREALCSLGPEAEARLGRPMSPFVRALGAEAEPVA